MKSYLLVLLLLFVTLYTAFSQQAVINITSGKNPKKIQISFANSKGEIINTQNTNEGLTPNEFHNSEFIYLFVEPYPKEDWTTFKEKMILDELNSVSLVQNNLIIKHDIPYPDSAFNDAKGNITGILINYKKQMLDITSEFRFISLSDTSEPVKIHETYWEGYDKYFEISKKGNELYDDRKYLEAFTTLKVFITDTANVKGLSKFSFTEHNQKNILMNCAYMYKERIDTTFTLYQYRFLKTYEESLIGSLDSLNKLMQKAQGFFSGYLNYMESMNDSSAIVIKETMAKRSIEFDKTISQNKITLEKRKLMFLSKDTYEKPPYELFVDLIAKMLTHNDSLAIIKSLDTLKINNLISFYPEKYKELDYGKAWKETFNFLVRYLNKSIVRNKYVFADSTMEKIEAQRSIQKQPYYEILTAFNWLGLQNFQKFRQYLDTALITVTDSVMIGNIQNWLINVKLTENDYEMINLFNEGLRYAEDENIDHADTSFMKVSYLQPKFAPVHYQMAMLFYKKNESAMGEIRLQSAIQIDSTYVSAWIMYLQKLYEANEFTKAEETVNKALKVNQLWIFYYYKALILEKIENVKKTEEGITLIETQCIPRNKYNSEQYYLLAELYLKSARKDKIDKARQAVTKVTEFKVNPGPRFEEVMKKINEKENAPSSGKPY